MMRLKPYGESKSHLLEGHRYIGYIEEARIESHHTYWVNLGTGGSLGNQYEPQVSPTQQLSLLS